MSDKNNDDEIIIREAKKEDMVAVAEMIQELADFEKMSDGPKLTVAGNNALVVADAADLERDGFESVPPAFSCLVAEAGVGEGREGRAGRQVVGYALYCRTYSTWRGAALLLEDLYVRAGRRRRGIGRRLFNAVAHVAHSGGCARMEFHVLQWNEARAFYGRAGAVDLTERELWHYWRLSGPALHRAARAPRAHRPQLTVDSTSPSASCGTTGGSPGPRSTAPPAPPARTGPS